MADDCCWRCSKKSGFKWEKKPCPEKPREFDVCKDCFRCQGPHGIGYITTQINFGHLTPVQITKGPRLAEIIYDNGHGEYINAKCEGVNDRGDFLRDPTSVLRAACWPESKWLPRCEGTSGPQPPEPPPAPIPPSPVPSACPFTDSLSYVGVALLNIRPTSGQAIREGYLGKVYVFHATPHSDGAKGHCPHQPDRRQCEQLYACQAPEGPDFFMSLQGQWSNERCDKQSSNSWICHHKAKKSEVGPTTVCAVPKGDKPNSPRGRCVTVDVR